MTNRFLISVAAAALIASTGFANAQGAGGSMGQGGSGAAQQSGPGGGGAATQHRDESGTKSGQSGGMKSGQSEKSGTVGQAPDKSGAGATTKGREDKGGMTQGREGHEKGGTVGQGREDKNMTQGREGREKSGTVGQGREEKGMTQGREGRDKDKGGTIGQGREDKGMTQGREGREDRMNAPGRAEQNQGTTTDRTQTQGGRAGSQTTGMAPAAPPPEKRTEIQSAIKSERIEDVGANVNVNVAVGTRLPDTVRFYPLPPRIVEIYPEWRGYEVVRIHGRYVIVRPQTREIVYIIEG